MLSINILCLSTTHFCSQQQPLGTRPCICFSYNFTERKHAPLQCLGLCWASLCGVMFPRAWDPGLMNCAFEPNPVPF